MTRSIQLTPPLSSSHHPVMRSWLSRLVLACAAAAVLSGCANPVATRGKMLEDERLASIKVGQSHREDVVQALGSPTTAGTFDEKIWYYIGQKTEQKAFFAPDVVERKVVKITFDDRNVVQKVETLDPNLAQSIDVVDRKTATAGNDTSILQDLLSNLGRFPTGGGSLGGTQSGGTTRRQRI